MAMEDIIQLQDFGFLDVTVTGTTVVVNAKQGPISAITAPANGELSVTLSQGVPADDFVAARSFGQSDFITCNLKTGQTDTVKGFDVITFADGLARATAYRLRMVLKRKMLNKA